MTNNSFDAERLRGTDIIGIFISDFIDQIKILKIEINDNESKEKMSKQCDEIIKAARAVQQMLEKH